MQIRQFGLELDDGVMGAGNVAGAAGAGAVAGRGRGDRRDHNGMATHAEIIVGAPDGDFARLVRLAFRAPQRIRESCSIAFKIRKNAIAALRFQAFDRPVEVTTVIHTTLSFLARHPDGLIRMDASQGIHTPPHISTPVERGGGG